MRLTLVSATGKWTVWRIYGENDEYTMPRVRCDHPVLRKGIDGWLVWREGLLYVADTKTIETEELPRPTRPGRRS